jgi:hypothetical protein
MKISIILNKFILKPPRYNSKVERVGGYRWEQWKIKIPAREKVKGEAPQQLPLQLRS